MKKNSVIRRIDYSLEEIIKKIAQKKNCSKIKASKHIAELARVAEGLL